jgi:hypothetical protein
LDTWPDLLIVLPHGNDFVFEKKTSSSSLQSIFSIRRWLPTCGILHMPACYAGLGYSGISIFRAAGQVRSFLPRYIGDSLFIPLNVISVPGFSLLFKNVYLCYVDVESTSKIFLPLYNDLN